MNAYDGNSTVPDRRAEKLAQSRIADLYSRACFTCALIIICVMIPSYNRVTLSQRYFQVMHYFRHHFVARHAWIQAPSVPQQVSPAVHILVQLCWHFHVAWFAGQFFHCGQETWQASGGVDAAAVVPDVAPFAVAQDAILDVTPVPQVDWAHSRAGGVPALCILCVCDVC